VIVNRSGPLGRARSLAKQVRDRVRVERYRVGSGRWVYRFGSRAFDRETDAVFSGIKQHYGQTRRGSELFELRRRIHMLEKGLTMRPRRETFAADYIEALVGRVEQAQIQHLLDAETTAWIRDVLAAYFEATATSTDLAIGRARRRYAGLAFESPLGYLGPETAGVKVPAVDFGSFARMAHGRRSVRWYKAIDVDREIIDRAVSVALEAPSACNRVPYRFEIFQNPDDARRVAAVAGGTAGYVDGIHHVAVVVGDLSAFLSERDRHLIYIDGSLATMSFVYALETEGIASCCINWPDLAEPERAMRDLIGLSRHERVVMLVAFGYADEHALVPQSPKRSLNEARRFRELERGA
jgi:nitroreductase